MGKKSRLKSKKAAPPNVTDNQNGAVASKEEQILSMCREYVSSFKPLIELKNENQKLKRAIIPNDFDTLMKHYVAPFLYRETMVKIRSELSGHKLFVSFTNSCNGHCFCDCGGEKEMIDVIIGTLKLDGPGQAFIINSVPKDNESPGIPFFVKLFIDSVKLLWPDDDLKVHSLDIILFITDHDEERYKAFVELHTALYPQLHYHECVDSSFVNEIEDFLKYSFEDAYEFIDDLVIFLDEDLKGMSRSELCSKYNFTSIPNAIFSRNFIEMSFFVYDNYNNLIKYLEDISPQSTCSELLKKPQVKTEFAEIKAAFSSFVSAKKFLKTKPIPSLKESISIIESVHSKWEKWPFFNFLASYMKQSLDDNQFSLFKCFSKIVEAQDLIEYHQDEIETADFEEWQLYKYFRYTPVVAPNRCYYFPNFHQLIQFSHTIPMKYFNIYSTIYSHFEETNQNELVYEDLIRRRLYRENNIQND